MRHVWYSSRGNFQEILEFLRSQMLSPIPPASVGGLRQLADKMEKILLVALENFGTTFVEPKVELGARFGHLVCECPNVESRFGHQRFLKRILLGSSFLLFCSVQCAFWTFIKSLKRWALS